MQKFNRGVKQKVGILILVSQVFSILAPLITLAAPQSASGTDTKNSLETVGTKANRLKTLGDSGVDESSGAFTYSYPINVPKGKNGMEPGLVVSYNSQSSENGIFGYGMNFTLPYIERTAKYGTDKIYTKNDFVSSLGGELILKPNSTNEYIQKIDDGSYQLYTFANNIWTLTDRSGNIYTYGSTLDSRLSDETGNKIQKYFLTETKDTLGNKVKYFYEKKNGYVYPKEISYTQDRFGAASNKIVFERETRSDTDISYKSAFRVTLDERVKSVKMYTDNLLVGQVDFTYTTGQNGTRSLLSSIKENRLGSDGVMTTMPETKFEFELGNNLTFQSGSEMTDVNSNTLKIDINGDAKPESLSTIDNTNSGYSWKIIDFNGDYFPDMYYFIKGINMCSGCSVPQKDTGSIKINKLGNFTTIPYTNVNLPQTGVFNMYSQPVNSTLNILDINADGLQDVMSGDNTYLNNGGSFSLSSFNKSSENMEDINGDGLPDLISNYSSTTNASSSGMYVFLNNGNGFNSTPEFNFKIPVEFKMKSTSGNDIDAGVRFVDINTDGLPDIVKSWTSNQVKFDNEYVQANGPNCFGWCPPDMAVQGSLNEVYINNGKSFVKNNNINFGGNFAIIYDKGYPVGPWNPYYVRSVYAKSFADTDYNGSPDFGGGISSFKKQDVLKTITSPLGSKVDVTYKGSATGNNPNLPINILVVDQIKETETLKNLTETTSYTFEGGKMYYDANNIYDRRFAGFKKVTTQKGIGDSSQKTIRYFHQGDGDDATLYERGDSFHNIGKVFKEELYGKVAGADFKYSESYRTYGVYEYAGQVYKYPKTEISTSYDEFGGKLSKATLYEYDLAARLPKQVVNYGKVNFDISTNAINDIDEDAIISKNIFNTKRPQKLLSEEVTDINGKFLNKKVYFYDELPFGYVERGLPTEERDYSSANIFTKKNIFYNEKGLPQISTDNNGNQTTFTYDENNNPITVTNALGQKVTSEYNKYLGVATKSTDANGKVVQTVYDGFGRVKSISATTPDGSIKNISNKTYTYGIGFTESENILKDGVIYKTNTNTYDTFGRLVSNIESLGSSAKRIDNTYNNLGQLITTTYPYDANSILGSYLASIDTKYFYDSLGRVVKIVNGDNESNVTYFVNGKKTSDNTSFGHEKTYTYNTSDKIISIVEENGSAKYETKYTWNLLGNLTSITDAEGNVRNFTYDGEGRLLTQEDLHKSSDNTYGVYKYKYDAVGNLIEKKDPSQNIFSYTYDNLYRPTSENASDLKTTYSYDNCKNGIGKVCSIINANYSQMYTYKPTGDVETESKTIDGKIFTNAYSYNSLGQVVSISLPDASVLNYDYDINGKQKSVSLTTQKVGSTTKTTNIVTDAKYNIDGTIKEMTYGNTVKSCYRYSTSNGALSAPRLSDVYVMGGGDCNTLDKANPKNLYVQNLNYDKGGSIIKNIERYAKDTSDIVSNFTYDELSRLTSTDVLQNNLNVVNNISYSPIGNILSSDNTKYSYLGTDYANPHAPSIIGNNSLVYDLNGNVMDDGKNLYNWNIKNTLARQENAKSISEYSYDINGERIKEIVKVKKTGTSTDDTRNQDYIDDVLFANILNQNSVQPNTKTYISKEAYLELKNILNVATVTQTDIYQMIGSISTSNYVKNSCRNILDSKKDLCERDNTLKVLYVKYAKEKNINISYGTIQEIWNVYKGNLNIPNDTTIYTSQDNRKFTVILDSNNSTSYNGNFFGNYKDTGSYLNVNSDSNPILIWNKLNLVDTSLFSLKNAAITIKNSANTYTPVNVYEITQPIDISNIYFKSATTTTGIISTSSSNVDGGYGWWTVSFPVTSFINKQDRGENFYGVALANKSTTTNAFQLYSPSYNWDILRPKIDLEYQFLGTLNTFNKSTTTLVAVNKIDSIYSDYTKGVNTQSSASKTNTYVSENSFNELNTANLTSENKIAMLFALALESGYPQKVCAGKATDCQKIEMQKFVAGYLYQKYNIKLTNTTLEEMYSVYLGNLLVGNSIGDYEKDILGKPSATGTLQTGLNCNLFYTYFEQYPQPENAYWVKNYKSNCYQFSGIISTKSIRENGNKVMMKVTLETMPNKKGVPVKLTASNYLWSYSGSKDLIVDMKNENVKTVLMDITDSFVDVKTGLSYQPNNTNYDMSLYLSANFVNEDDLAGGVSVKKVEYVVGDFGYVGKINSNISPVLTTNIIANEIYNKANTNLYGYLYKENKIPSLFASPKYISKEAFNEIANLSISYTNLVIYDRLINYNFAPYASCDNLTGDANINCKKTIMVKYLYAIIKYEKDVEISSQTLEEISEVLLGNLSVPNNLDEYKIRNTKVYTIINNSIFTNLAQTYPGFFYTAKSEASCNVGTWSNPYLNTYDCDLGFNIPQEVVNRKNEIENVKVDFLFNQNRIDNTGNTSPNVIIYPIIRNAVPYWENFGYSADSVFPINTYKDYGSDTVKVNLAAMNTFNITKITKSFATNEFTNYGIRLIGNNGSNAIVSNANSYNITVDYAKDTDQMQRNFVIPLIANPKDSNIENNILNILARVDKDYKTSTNAIISRETFEEVKNSTYISKDKINEIFDQNEKLQKDDTLAAVWSQYKTKSSQELTREALEELYMVWKDQLAMPEDYEQYTFANGTTTIVAFDKNTWKPYSENNNTAPVYNYVKTQDNCTAYSNGINYLCDFQIPKLQKKYLKDGNISLTINYPSPQWLQSFQLKGVLSELNASSTIIDKKLTNAFVGTDSAYTTSTTYDLTQINAELNENGKKELEIVMKQSNYMIAWPMIQNANTINVSAKINYQPTFSVYDRSKLTNLSVVPGVFSIRFLGDNDLISVMKNISPEGLKELATVSINNRSDILQFTKTIPNFDEKKGISKVDKINALSKINSEIIRIKNIKLSREALEEIYYAINNKLIIQDGIKLSTVMTDISGVISNYKFEGQINSNDKKKDELRPASPVFMENTVLSVDGRKGEVNGAYNFLGNAYLAMPNFQPTPTNGSYTFSTWIKTGGSPDSFIMQLGAPSTPYNYMRLQYWRNVVNTEVVSGGSYTTYNVGTKTINDNKWHKIDFVLDNTGPAKSTIYIDGVKDSENTFTGKHNFANLSNEILLGSGRNPGINNKLEGYFTGSIDEFKVWSKALTPSEIKTSYDNDNSNAANIVANLEVFPRSSFGILEPITNVTSTKELSLENNISYSIKDADVKIVSDDTKGELGLVGITTRDQIATIMNMTPVVLKDSKIHFFKEYIKQNKGFELSREALEEVYLIYSEKEIFSLSVDQLTTLKDKSDIKINYLSTQNGAQFTGCAIGPVTPKCDFEFSIPQKAGYRVTKANLYFNGEVKSSYGNIAAIFNLGNTKTPISNVMDLSQYIPLTNSLTYRGSVFMQGYDVGSISSISINVGTPQLEIIYTPITDKMDRLSFGSLEDISNFTKLKNSYEQEIASQNVSTSSVATTTKYILSAQATNELASTTLTSTVAVKNLFANASSSQIKEYKLYDAFLNVKKASGVELSRATLEELWNVNNDLEIFPSEAIVNVKNNFTKTYPFVKGSAYTAYTWNGNTYYDIWCMALGYTTSECYLKFNVPQEVGATVQSAKIKLNSWNYGNGPFEVSFYRPNTEPQKNTRPVVVEFSDSKHIISGSSGSASAPVEKDITNLVKNSQNWNGAMYVGVGKSSTQAYAYPHTAQLIQIQNDGYGGLYGLIDPTLTITWDQSYATSTLKYFNRDTLTNYLIANGIDKLESIYKSIVTSSTTLTTSTPVCNQILETCTQVDNTSTTTLTQPTFTTTLDIIRTSISNPYNYPYTIDNNNTPIFYLPTGATTTDPNTKIYNTLAKNMQDWNKIDNIYTKYFPSLYYEYDNRGYSTINIPFNGKTIATYRYNDIGTLEELSYLSLNYQGSPVIATDTTTNIVQTIKQDAWGVKNQNTFDSNSVLPTDFGYTGHKYDADSDLTYAHARYYDGGQRTWKSEDPMAISGFSSDRFLMDPQTQNSYSYSANDPVNKVDPDGKVWIFVNGTQMFGGATKEDYWKDTTIAQSIKNDPMFKGQDIGYFTWSGDDNEKTREQASYDLQKFIDNTMKLYGPNEPLNILMHSHGYQVGALYSWCECAHKINNFVSIESPATGLVPNYNMIQNHVQTYSNLDLVQYLGGLQHSLSDIMGAVLYTPAMSGGLNGVFSLNWGQFGVTQSRQMPGAKNVDVTSNSFNPYLTPWNTIVEHSTPMKNQDAYKKISPNLKP